MYGHGFVFHFEHTFIFLCYWYCEGVSFSCKWSHTSPQYSGCWTSSQSVTSADAFHIKNLEKHTHIQSSRQNPSPKPTYSPTEVTDVGRIRHPSPCIPCIHQQRWWMLATSVTQAHVFHVFTNRGDGCWQQPSHIDILKWNSSPTAKNWGPNEKSITNLHHQPRQPFELDPTSHPIQIACWDANMLELNSGQSRKQLNKHCCLRWMWGQIHH